MRPSNYPAQKIPQSSKRSPICIEYMGKNLELGYSWEEISKSLDQEFHTDQKLASALRLCLIEQLKAEIPISDQSKKEAMKKYYQSMKKQ